MLELMMGVSSGNNKKLDSNVPGLGEGGDDRNDKFDNFRVRDANGLCELDDSEGDGDGSLSYSSSGDGGASDNKITGCIVDIIENKRKKEERRKV
jgi:hypothetical protein